MAIYVDLSDFDIHCADEVQLSKLEWTKVDLCGFVGCVVAETS